MSTTSSGSCCPDPVRVSKAKEISTGALAVRRFGSMFHDREFADVLLRHQVQSGSSNQDITEPFPVRCSASFLRVGPDASREGQDEMTKSGGCLATAWRQPLIDNVHDSDGCRVFSLDGTMKIAMVLRVYETRILHREEGVLDNRVDDNTYVYSYLEGGLLGGSQQIVNPVTS